MSSAFLEVQVAPNSSCDLKCVNMILLRAHCCGKAALIIRFITLGGGKGRGNGEMSSHPRDATRGRRKRGKAIRARRKQMSLGNTAEKAESIVLI